MPGTQAYRAVKRICQYLNVHQIKQGQRLPTHQELASILGCSNDTLMAAMRELTACGALERRAGVGTLLANPRALPELVWSVGMILVPAQAYGPGSVFIDLAMRLQVEFARRRWRTILYCHIVEHADDLPDLKRCGPLLQDHEQGMLDALVSFIPIAPPQWKLLEDAGTVVYHTPYDEEAPCGLVVDETEMAIESAKLLASRGCRKLAVICLTEDPEPRRRYWPALRQALRQQGLSFAQLENINVPKLPGIMANSHTLARQLLARPDQKRPDGLILLDDHVAVGLTEHLARQDAYRPHITAITHLQLPHAFHLPVVRFEVDLHEMAGQIMDDLQTRIINPSTPPQLQTIRSVMQSPRARRIPSFLIEDHQER